MNGSQVGLLIFGIIVVLLLIAGGMFGCPQYNVWQKGLKGKAALEEAEWNRQISIEEAKAARVSAEEYKEVEITRAEGVAESIKIIGKGLEANEAYLRYLWVNALAQDQTDVIYVPTEANLPILEATRGMK